jgi:GNAT superfamily N-acetyltransferase
MKIVDYRRKYLDQVVELNKSLVQSWYRQENRKNVKSSYDLLSMKDQFRHGGPWLHPETCAVHMTAVAKIGTISLLIDDSDTVLGEIEYHLSADNRYHLDWMVVSSDQQGKGMGTKLIDNMKKRVASSIETEPEEGVQQFYEKNKFYQVKPSHYRYLLKPVQTRENTRSENIRLSDFKSRTGESNHDDFYLDLLLSTGIKYADLFGDNYPLHTIEDDDFMILIRDLPSLDDRRSVSILSYADDANPELSKYISTAYHTFLTVLGKRSEDYLDFKSNIPRLIFNP